MESPCHLSGKRTLARSQLDLRSLGRHSRPGTDPGTGMDAHLSHGSKEKKLASEEKDQINQRIRELEAELQNASENGRLENKFTESFQQYTEIEELTADIVNDVLQEIVVFPDRVFNIVWNYRDELESLLLDVNTKKQAENSDD